MTDEINWAQVTFQNTKDISTLTSQVSNLVSGIADDRRNQTAHNEQFFQMFKKMEEAISGNKDVANETKWKTAPVVTLVIGASRLILTAFMGAIIALVLKTSGILKF